MDIPSISDPSHQPHQPSLVLPPVLGGLQVQDPGGGPGHGTQDHEDPNLEADAEEGVGLGSMAGSMMSCERSTDGEL